MKTLYRLTAIILFSFLAIVSFAQDKDIENPIPLDQNVIRGTLENGLKYYIRPNEKPEKRVEFRLVVNAGSILEDDDQQGLAHFLEHMAFNGTEDFSKNDLISFLEQSGVDFGADLNAYTSFDETVYMFQIPSDRQGLLDTAFMILENWAHKLSLDEDEIDKERGVVREEWRLGLGAQDRMMKKYIPVLFKDSRYAERLPIGKMSVIDSCEYDVVRRFYHDWYRPDLMAVVVVGDIDPDYAKDKIISHFSGMTGPEVERDRTVHIILNNNPPLIAIATDKEATGTSVALIRKLDKYHTKTYADYRLMLRVKLYTGMLNNRFFEARQNPESPFIYAGAGYGGFVARPLDAFFLSARVKEDRINEAITELMKENRRIKRYGFTESELERQKNEILGRFEKALEEKDKTESRRFVREYVNHFLESEPYMDIEFEAGLVKKLIPEIRLEEVNQVSYFVGKPKNLLVLVTAPEEEGLVIPSEEEIKETIIAGRDVALEEYKEEAVRESLITNVLPGGAVVNAIDDQEFGIKELELDNGVRVILKPTEFKNDEILMSAFGPGGTSLASDEAFISASFSNRIISQSGVGDFDNIALNKFMTGKNLTLDPEIKELSQGLKGKSVKKDLETMLQLSYLYFTEPRKDTNAFKTFQSAMLNQFKFMMANPQAVFYDTLYKLATQNHPRTIVIPTEKQINSINLEEAYSFYQQSFASAQGFTFVFVGSFDTDSLTPLITKYLGSLPSDGKTKNWKDVSPVFPDGITQVTVRKGTEPKASVALMMDEKFDWSVEERLKMSLLMKILNIRMRESMREDQGGVYGVRARPNIEKYPRESINVTISWGCAPENVDQLVQTVFREMDTLRSIGPKAINMNKAKETTIRDYETNFEKNNYWLNKIKNMEVYGEDLLSFEEMKMFVQNVRSEDLQKLANKYFREDHYLKLVLLPEED